jgi:hypothetical protein
MNEPAFGQRPLAFSVLVLTEDVRVLAPSISVIRHTKQDKKNPPSSIPFPVPNVEEYGKSLKCHIH